MDISFVNWPTEECNGYLGWNKVPLGSHSFFSQPNVWIITFGEWGKASKVVNIFQIWDQMINLGLSMNDTSKKMKDIFKKELVPTKL